MGFKTHYIEECKQMLAANGGTTMGHDRYRTGGAYNTIEDDGSSLAETIVQYAERALTAEAQVSDLESQLAALKMSSNKQPPQTGYYAPNTAYGMMPGAPPPPTTINMPPTYHMP